MEFERFTPDANRMMGFAHREAKLLNHGYVGTEHILLAVVQMALVRDCEEGRFVLEILTGIGVSPSVIRRAVESHVPAGRACFSGALPHTSGVQSVIVGAYEEARGLQHNQVAPVHIFLALMRKEVECHVAGFVLQSVFHPAYTHARIRQIVRDTLAAPALETHVQPSASATSGLESELRRNLEQARKNPVVARRDVSNGAETLHTMLLSSMDRAQRALELSGSATNTPAEARERIASGHAWAILAQAAAIAEIAALAREEVTSAENAKPQ